MRNWGFHLRNQVENPLGSVYTCDFDAILLAICSFVPGGGGGVLIIFLGGGVPPSPENPYPISDQNIRFSIPYFRPDSQNVYPISDPVMCGNFSNSQWIYGVRDFMTPQTMFAVCFSSWSMSTATHITLKMVSQTKRTEYTPYFRPKWQHLYPISDILENGALWGGTYLYGLYMGVPPQELCEGGGGVRWQINAACMLSYNNVIHSFCSFSFSLS